MARPRSGKICAPASVGGVPHCGPGPRSPARLRPQVSQRTSASPQTVPEHGKQGSPGGRRRSVPKLTTTGVGASHYRAGTGNRAERVMAGRVTEFAVLGPWSLETSGRFWEGFTPAALAGGRAGPGLRTVFCAEGDWCRAEVEVTQAGDTARVVLAGHGDLDAAAAQVGRFLALDVDGRGWPDVARRDPVIADAQARLPGLRPCGFHSPYEAAAWSVLSQRLRIVQAARLRAELIARHGEDGAFPPPRTLARLDLDLPGRKSEYLRAVAEAAAGWPAGRDGAARPGPRPGRAARAAGQGARPVRRRAGRDPRRERPRRRSPPRTPPGR